jgi:uncharacterized iron-regulated protein
MIRLAAFFLALSALAFLPGYAMAASDPWTDWQAEKFRDHPLNGKIWSAEKRGFLTKEAYAEALRKADIVLLGENHDNPDHHRLQAWAISQIAKGREGKGAVVFEMIGADQAAALDAFAATKPAAADAAKLGIAVKWQERGWPAFALYQPIAEAALAAHFTLHAGDAAQGTIRQVGKQGTQSLGTDEEKRLGLDHALSPALQDALLDDLYDSHCQMVDKAKLGPMANVQRFRDATLAANLMSASEGGRIAILIAGDGHVRKDRGAPLYLRAQAKPPHAVAVMHIEVAEGVTDPAALVPKGPDGAPATDFAVFTPAAERGDPCEAFRKMKKG